MKDIKGFLGFTNFYRNLIIGYKEIAGLFYVLIKKDITFIWKQKEEDMFITFKGKIAEESIIYNTDPGKPYKVDIDISDFMIEI